MDIKGTRPDIAKKMQNNANAKRSTGGTALSAAFVKDGELLAAFACGTKNGNPICPATVYDLYNAGSVGKVYCALAVMKLVEMKKAALDTPVAVYLPQFTMKDGRYTRITPRMCLNHSSGLPGMDMKNFYCDKWMAEGAYEQFYDYLSKSKLKTDPGEISVYCNDGYVLAAMAVSAASGMDYMQFLREYITIPADAYSACAGDAIPENRTYIQEKGKPSEYRSVMGSGGILTDMADCARIGYLFIDPKGIFTPESLAEMTRPQGKSFIPGLTCVNFGLGWDSVCYKSGTFDFGEDALVKDGDTNSFSSHLIVSKHYNLSAAISMTKDNKIDHRVLLEELCAVLMNEYNTASPVGTVTLTDAIGHMIPQAGKKETPVTEALPVPPACVLKFSGTYYANGDILRVSFNACSFLMQKLTLFNADRSNNSDERNCVSNKNNWEDRIKNAAFDGRGFVSSEAYFTFEEHLGSSYLIAQKNHERYVAAQKINGYVPVSGLAPVRGYTYIDSHPPISGAWQNRIGKSYIICDANPADLLLKSAGTAVTVRQLEPEGILFFINNAGEETRALPTLPVGDDETEMFIDAPGYASRDIFAPFIFKKDGVEYLYANGFTYMDTAAVPFIQTGRVVFEKGEQNKVYRMIAGKRLRIGTHTGIRVIALDAGLNQWYENLSDLDTVKMADGYILFINESAMNIAVEVL